ncbi:MAG: hypothetical protein R2909_14955 [Gemmatimonadales bacterium]
MTKRSQGRERIVRGNPKRIAQARELSPSSSGSASRLNQLDAVLADQNPSPE